MRKRYELYFFEEKLFNTIFNQLSTGKGKKLNKFANSSAYQCCPLLHQNSKTKPASTVTMVGGCKATPKQIEKTKQELSEIFKANGLKITIDANKKTINFLSVTLHLASGSYKPFMKPNNKILYVHQASSHLPPPPPSQHWKTSRKTSINDWPASHL